MGRPSTDSFGWIELHVSNHFYACKEQVVWFESKFLDAVYFEEEKSGLLLMSLFMIIRVRMAMFQWAGALLFMDGER